MENLDYEMPPVKQRKLCYKQRSITLSPREEKVIIALLHRDSATCNLLICIGEDLDEEWYKHIRNLLFKFSFVDFDRCLELEERELFALQITVDEVDQDYSHMVTGALSIKLNYLLTGENND